MRNPAFFLGLAACFLSFYAIGLTSRWGWFAPAETPAPTVSAEAMRATPPLPAASPSAPSPAPAKVVAEGKGADLSQALQAGLGPFAHLEPGLRQRFDSAYPAAEPARTAEAVDRLSILKALENGYANALPHAQQGQLLQLYLQVAGSRLEDPAVRRQAWRNVAARAATLDEDARLELFSRVPERFLASAGKTERELLQEIFDEAP